MDYPHLLGVLLRMLSGELPWTTRREVIRCMGIIGALDPATHKRNLHGLVSGARPSNASGGGGAGKGKGDQKGGGAGGGAGGAGANDGEGAAALAELLPSAGLTT